VGSTPSAGTTTRKLPSMSSVKFLQINIPCNECLVQASCKEKEKIDEELKKYELYNFLLSLRKWDESKKMYRKGLIEAWVNMGHDIVFTMRSDESNGVPNRAQPTYINALIEIMNTLQWMINSQSWRDGMVHDFDKEEVAKKLKQAIGWI
jgi:hypothetical protein